MAADIDEDDDIFGKWQYRTWTYSDATATHYLLLQ